MNENKNWFKRKQNGYQKKRNTFGNKSNLNSKTYIIISKQFSTYKKKIKFWNEFVILIWNYGLCNKNKLWYLIMIAWTRLGLPLTLKKVKTTFREDKKEYNIWFTILFDYGTCFNLNNIWKWFSVLELH